MDNEWQCVWEVLTKQIDALDPQVDAAYDAYVDGLVALRKLKHERGRMWREKVTALAKTP